MIRVNDAMLTGFARGTTLVNPAIGPQGWIRGAVYRSDGGLVRASQRCWAGDPMAPISADPPQITVDPDRGRRLEGRWIYAGHWPRHFGHFFLEMLSSLWPDPAETRVEGLIAHRRFHGDIPLPGRTRRAEEIELRDWEQEFLELAGYGGLPVVEVQTAPAHVETLLVPSRPVVLKSWAWPRAVELWQRVAAGVEAGDDRRVFLSRRLFHEERQHKEKRARSDRSWDRRLEKIFSAFGFRIVYPETLPLREQLSIVRGADVLAGPSGSALHLSAFARPGTKVLEVGDLRSESVALSTQRMIDAACGHSVAFCAHGEHRALQEILGRL